MKLIYNVDDRPKFGQMIVFAIQQLLAIMAATLVVPIIINGNAGLEGEDAMSTAAALFGAGVGTLIYVLFTRKKSPVFLGSSFAFLGSMTAAFAGAAAAGATVALGYIGLLIGAVLAGLVYVIIAIIVKFVGVKWINKLMPAVVIGPTVAIIGLSLAGNAIGDLQKANYVKNLDNNNFNIVQEAYVDEDENASEGGKYVVLDDNGNVNEGISVGVDKEGKPVLSTVPGSTLIAVLCGIITLIVTMLCSTYGKKTARLIPFIIGILCGYAVAAIFTAIGFAADIDALKICNFSSLTALTAGGVTLETFITVPKFTFLTAFGGFKELSASYIGTIAVAYVPVAFVVFAEHIADHKNLSSIIEKDLLEDPGLSRTLLGDGVGSMFGAFFGGCPNTTYGESIGCVAITRNASVYTIIAAAVGAIVVSFIAPFVAFVNSIPSCVMGGVCMALYGFIAVSGLKMVQGVDLNENKNLFVVSAILIAGIGGLSLTFGKIKLTAIAAALILGIIVNIILSRKKETVEEK